METNAATTHMVTLPSKALSAVLDHVWEAELEGYLEYPSPGHLFMHLVELANVANGKCSWTQEDYIHAYFSSAEATWRMPGSVEHVAPHESPVVRVGSAIADSDVAWEQQGGTKRYLIRGKASLLRVVVGWDSPLNTFFAQVWKAPDEETCYEMGELLLWVGTFHREVPVIKQLGRLVAPYVRIPSTILENLEFHRLMSI
ncbi:MAG: hypothetical protein GC190_20065 [Alphaproteobacteria bacterium]|nr:hypothetical protein [Alphaproteobacteria bacterium]